MTTTTPRPLLLDAESVRAVIAGTKTMHRVPVKPQPTVEARHNSFRNVWRPKHAKLSGNKAIDEVCGPTPCCVWMPDQDVMETGAAGIVQWCPFGEPGDRLWVREAWGLFDTLPSDGPENAILFYRATDEQRNELRHQLWRPAITMPRWASRLELEIVEVRVERLDAISEEDAIAEGCRALTTESWRHPGTKVTQLTAAEDFADRWNRRHPKHPWESSPWCWVISFKVLQGESK